MGDQTRQRKKSSTSAGIKPTTSGFDQPLLSLLQREHWSQLSLRPGRFVAKERNGILFSEFAS